MSREVGHTAGAQVLTGYPRLQVPLQMGIVRTQYRNRGGLHQVNEEPVVHKLMDEFTSRFHVEVANSLGEVKLLMVEGTEAGILRMFL
jgi:hypothetical protein